jgi:hypothetical protein
MKEKKRSVMLVAAPKNGVEPSACISPHPPSLPCLPSFRFRSYLP